MRDHDLDPIEPETLPAVIPVLTVSALLGIGKNQTYAQIHAGTYPVRVLPVSGHYKVSRYDLLRYLGAPLAEPELAGSDAA